MIKSKRRRMEGRVHGRTFRVIFTSI